MANPRHQVVTVTLNPAIDQTVTASNFTAGSVNRVETVRIGAAGKGVNVAAALADFGHPVVATGFLGRENTAIFEELFRRKAIADDFIRVSGQTRTGIKIVDRARQETTDINFPGASPAPEEIALLRNRLAALACSRDMWIVFAGSLPPGVDPGIYADLIQLVKSNGARVALDTSGEPLQRALTAAPDFLKPNIDELSDLVGHQLKSRDDIISAARDFIARGTNVMAISMAENGAFFVSANEAIHAQPPSIKIHTTVGAGDAMVAGFVAGQLRGIGLAESARMATAFSLDALSRGEAGISGQDTIQSFHEQVLLS